ncbi:DUF1877 family protein [Micromonospora sp. WP24]|uniref:DUF1877 family protein n=1 Tax=Micromonospora sp. WP24 TaxID=2604469 RepID=UPI0021042CCE|nr:DUF1877 family protein [Micromonospora sp. WP24]
MSVEDDPRQLSTPATHHDLRKHVATIGEDAASGDRATDKAWNGLDFLLHRLDFDVPLVLGAKSFVKLPDVEPDSEEMFDFLDNLEANGGHGPPSYLTPDQGTAAATQLAELTEDNLIRGVDPQELHTRRRRVVRVAERAEIYRFLGETRRAGMGDNYLPGVRSFFTAAPRTATRWSAAHASAALLS